MTENYLNELKALLPPDNAVGDEALRILLRRAENTVLDVIGREELPERLRDCVTSLALIMYDRMGAEGEARRREGDVDMSYIDGLPGDIRDRLKNYPRKVGAINAACKKQT